MNTKIPLHCVTKVDNGFVTYLSIEGWTEDKSEASCYCGVTGAKVLRSVIEHKQSCHPIEDYELNLEVHHFE